MTTSNLGPQKAVWGAVASSIVAFLSAVLAGLLAVGDGATLGDLDTAVWITAVIAAITAAVGTGATVYKTTNKPR